MADTGPGRPTGLRRDVGLPGAVLLGLGSIVGTGLFVSLGIAAGTAGSGVLVALPLAGLLALCNGLSSAQLAAAHPVSGGTYEYGYRVLGPEFGFTAGWVFLLAKSASAATAALGFGGYLLSLLHLSVPVGVRTIAAVALVALVTLLVSGGIRRSNRSNAVIVGFTLVVLAGFVGFGASEGWAAIQGLLGTAGAEAGSSAAEQTAAATWTLSDLARATALLFVAYTGYGRIATLGEEVSRPEKTIPRAIVLTLAATALLYLAVAAVGIGILGPDGFALATETSAAPLAEAARALGTPGLEIAVELAAATAMVAVLLNLILGLSRVALAMARRRDLPAFLAGVDAGSGSPRAAVLAVGIVIAVLALAGDVETTWSFSAFAVLLYYGITNLAALRLPPDLRRYPRVVALAGLGGCVFLAFQVPTVIWGIGSGVVLVLLGLRMLLPGRA